MAEIDFLTFDSPAGDYLLETEYGREYEIKIPEDIIDVTEMRVPEEQTNDAFAHASIVDVYGIMARLGEPAVLTIDNHEDSDLKEFFTAPVTRIEKID